MKMTDKSNEAMKNFRKLLAELPTEQASKFAALALKEIAKERGKSRIGVTKADKSPTKKARKKSASSRAKNRQISNKKSRPTGSKKRK